MYYKMITNANVDTYISEEPELPREIRFTSGKFIDRPVTTPLKFKIESYNTVNPVDYHKRSIPVMSKRFVDVFSRIGVDNIQTYPAILEDASSGKTWDNYFAVNIVGKIACADMRSSKIVNMGAGMVDFDELVLDRSKIKSSVFFRLGEQPSKIIVNKKLIDELKKIDNPKFKGASFRYIEVS